MEPIVSICCKTYNHEKYIADALDSFLMQEASFPYEIIVHDDASTDRTAEIIREYERKYPGIVKPIYQKENKYSKGIKITQEYIVPNIKGIYVATCEGDDFWTDKYKLQKQVDFLDKHKDYTMCFHKVRVVDTNKKDLGRYKGLTNKGSKKIGVVEAAKGGIVHVSSIVIRSDFYSKTRPIWIKESIHGGYDYASALYMVAEGKIYYFDEIMSAYRSGVENSMMTNFKTNYSKDNDIKYHTNRIETLKMADEYYEFKFNDAIEKVNLCSYVVINLLKNDFSSLARINYKKYIYQNGLMAFIKLLLLKKCPNIASCLVKLKGKLSLIKNEQVN